MIIDTPINQTANVLIVDDRPENLYTLEVILKGTKIIKAGSGKEALLKVLNHEIALILLDVQMPEMDGYEVATLLRSNADTCHIPIIFITAISKEKQNIFQGYDSGAVDYLFKPLEPEILKRKVSIFLDLYNQNQIIKNQNKKLNDANLKILKQQGALIEDERLKVVLQMAGAAAHELSQPLMVLLGNIELIEMDTDDPKKVLKYIPKIKEAGQRLSETVNKIHIFDHEEAIAHNRKAQVLNLGRKIKILSVEDDDRDFNKIALILEKGDGMTLFREKIVESALQRLDKEKFDVILLDFALPDGTGLDVLKSMNLKKNKTPVIFLTGQGDEIIASRTIRKGAYDYLTKSETGLGFLLSTIKNVLEKYRLKQDIDTALKRMAAMSTKDELTGLYNRRYMNDVLEQEFNRTIRYENSMSCLLLDLDFFKSINDNYGHDCGDYVLQKFAHILLHHKRSSDYIFRYGGEEFLVLLPQTNAKGAQSFAENIRKACENNEFHYKTHPIKITVSIGISSVQNCKASKGNDLVQFADKALYRAKADGRNCIREFERHVAEEILPEKEIYGEKGIIYLKEQMAFILEKTRQASVRSLELLIKDLGGAQLEQETRQIIEYINLLCKKLSLPYPIIKSITLAASLNGCFKILLGKELLQKSGGLTLKDKNMLESLPHMQIELANLFDFFTNEKSVLLHNHEWYDGNGYPNGFEADEIPIGARILSLASAAVAMRSDRPYRNKLKDKIIVSEIVNNAGTQFDPMLVTCFLDIIAENKLLKVSKNMIDKAKTEIGQIN
ncbi:MAG: diguanylate cyclase [Desulfobacterales bacterium]|nr:diguanylate cyclase [Desulfobacterales bacterium]MCP4162877.1 diguanylate cyclase [Deltaproteobacteria bacterium]